MSSSSWVYIGNRTATVPSPPSTPCAGNEGFECRPLLGVYRTDTVPSPPSTPCAGNEGFECRSLLGGRWEIEKLLFLHHPAHHVQVMKVLNVVLFFDVNRKKGSYVQVVNVLNVVLFLVAYRK
jgi:hypothetical protein